MSPAEKTAPRPIILLAEDSEDDAFILRRAIIKSGLPIELVWVNDGQEAVDYLERAQNQPGGNERMPALLLLDIKMPRMDGFDVLAWMYMTKSCKSLPAVMLSSSMLPADIEKARTLGAADYLVKTSGTGQLIEMVRGIHHRWLSSPATSTGTASSNGNNLELPV